ncbi:hypothetical protein TNCV_1294511 [Trichonephila clavipes]|nr:hypothetical protein TNCV_1294511 [Trichonephila clavipes]
MENSHSHTDPQTRLDPTLATSHRPITLPVLSKLAERIILNRLNDHLQKENDILIPQLSTVSVPIFTSHQLLRMVEYVKTVLRKTSQLGLFSSIQKAFDRVWHYGLLYKLIALTLAIKVSNPS